MLPTRFNRTKEITRNYKALKEKVEASVKVYDPVPESVAVERTFNVCSEEELFKSVKTAKNVFKAYENVAKDIVKLIKSKG